MDNRNTFGAMLLGIIILLFIIGGFILMNSRTSNNDVDINNKDDNVTDLRIDLTKDYVYYENTEEFLEEAEIHKEDVILNFKTLTELNTSLHNELEAMYSNIVNISDANIPNSVEYENNSKGIYSVLYREYVDQKFDNLQSLVILDYKYNVVDGSIIDNIKSYIVNINTGELVDSDTLLNTFNITDEAIIDAVTKRLNDTQVLDGDIQVIDINGTIDSIKNSDYNSGIKALSISKNGKLMLNFIVKSNKINYNDSVEID